MDAQKYGWIDYLRQMSRRLNADFTIFQVKQRNLCCTCPGKQSQKTKNKVSFLEDRCVLLLYPLITPCAMFLLFFLSTLILCFLSIPNPFFFSFLSLFILILNCGFCWSVNIINETSLDQTATCSSSSFPLPFLLSFHRSSSPHDIQPGTNLSPHPHLLMRLAVSWKILEVHWGSRLKCSLMVAPVVARGYRV